MPALRELDQPLLLGGQGRDILLERAELLGLVGPGNDVPRGVGPPVSLILRLDGYAHIPMCRDYHSSARRWGADSSTAANSPRPK
jgi:hypothetical protein